MVGRGRGRGGEGEREQQQQQQQQNQAKKEANSHLEKSVAAVVMGKRGRLLEQRDRGDYEVHGEGRGYLYKFSPPLSLSLRPTKHQQTPASNSKKSSTHKKISRKIRKK